MCAISCPGHECFRGGVIEQTGDDIPFANTLSQCDLHYLKSTIPPDSLLVIDEAQRIPNIGRALKLIVDNIAGVRVIVTGSSSFDLPRLLPDFLRFGMYPAVLTAATYQEKEAVVRELAGSYLLKDILDSDKIKDSNKIFDVLRLLAFQVGSQGR